MNFADNLSRLVQGAGDAAYAGDPDFLAAINSFIDSAEQRILRDLDLLSTRVPDGTGLLSPNRRNFVLPTDIGTFVVLETVRIVVNNVTLPALDPISKEAMDVVYPDGRAVGVPSIPRYWAPFDQQSILVGPPADQQYQVICVGTQRPAPLYTGTVNAGTSINVSPGTIAAIGTFISSNLPDLFLTAEMIAVSEWMRLFAATAEDPQQPATYIAEYERLKGSALIEEARKRLSAEGWGSRLPSPAARPPQT